MSQIGDVVDVCRRYFKAYGGVRAVVFSPYSQVALLITVACSGLWWSGPGSSAIVLQVLPNLLGFSPLLSWSRRFRAVWAVCFSKKEAMALL
jgi:hypothetical protein